VLSLNFDHEDITSLAGCYAVTALDLTGNESAFSNIVCVDNCPFYVLPNAFSPNEDGINDVFKPYNCIKFVRSAEFTIFNRWGEEMFKSNDDVLINWDGTDSNGEKLSSGVYYYHEKGYRFNNKEYLSIIFNSSSRQVRVVVGESMTPFIDNMVKNQIQKKMQGYVSKNEIIKGLEIGMKEIRRIITQNNDN